MSEDAKTKTIDFDDGAFVRTALVVDSNLEHAGSVDIVNEKGERLAELNIFAYQDGNLIVDVIDKDEIYAEKRALTFWDGVRNSISASHLVSADFRGRKNG